MVAGLSYEEVINETGLPNFVESLTDKESLLNRMREMREKFNNVLLKRGFGIIASHGPIVLGRRYIANIVIKHPETNEPSALEHNVVIDENGKIFDPAPEGKPPYRASSLREIVFLGN
jgi:hypothetical protein